MTIAIGLLAQLLLPSGAPVPLSPQSPMIGGPAIDWSRVSERAAAVPFDTARTRQRTRAVELGGAYHTRLVIHRWLSFSMIPIFAGAYFTGDQILKHDRSEDAPQWARSLHGPFAAATAIVFTGSTVTGVWNFWATRKDPAGRTRRILHSVLSLAADAGFAYAATIAPGRESLQQRRIDHRNWALASMGVSVVSGAMMLLFK